VVDAYRSRKGGLNQGCSTLVRAYLLISAALLFMYYRHNARFYRDVRAYYAAREARSDRAT
jgi:hypothetical protein